MSEALVELRDVSLGYDGRPVIEHVSFSIDRGEFIAFIGPNGAGKTTLLRGLLGLIPVLAGKIEDHFDRAASPPGYVPQREVLDSIFPLSVMEVVIMGTYARLPPLWPVSASLRRLAAECLDQVGLMSLAKRPFWALSGGQRQRVLIARALAAEPTIILLDEPTAGVDHEAEEAITGLITRLNHDRGLTVVLVTHHLDRIRSRVQSAVQVDDGQAIKQPLHAVDVPEAQAAGSRGRTQTK